MKFTAALAALLLFLPAIVWAQYAPQYPPARTAAPATPAARPAPAAASPAASAAPGAADPSSLLAQINRASQTTQEDLAGLRIERWKTDSGSKEQLQQQSDSLRRNLAAALPELVGQVTAHPDDMVANFKLYRNLNALYDVLTSLVDAANRVGPQEDYESLAREASAFDSARRAFADRMETMASTHDAELVKLRAQVKAAATPPASTKKTVIDDSKATKKTKTRKKTPPSSSSGQQ